MGETGNKSEPLTKMRLGPDFSYLAGIAEASSGEVEPLAVNVRRDPGEIPGFYADANKE
ncbi:MAG: hypothetical protein ACYDEQ_05240 [Desulfocucumaceae bacterium]